MRGRAWADKMIDSAVGTVSLDPETGHGWRLVEAFAGILGLQRYYANGCPRGLRPFRGAPRNSVLKLCDRESWGGKTSYTLARSVAAQLIS
jgi:hypothetical protein